MTRHNIEVRAVSRWGRRALYSSKGAARRSTTQSAQLRSAQEAIDRYRAHGSGRKAALQTVREQLDGLHQEVEDDSRWDRLVRLVRQAGDPWNADDWPLGFDALVCAIPLCTHVSFECAQCPIGRQQQGRSCAHPTSAFGRIGELVRCNDRQALRDHLSSLKPLVCDQPSHDPPASP